jgi:hypothetical protein
MPRYSPRRIDRPGKQTGRFVVLKRCIVVKAASFGSGKVKAGSFDNERNRTPF